MTSAQLSCPDAEIALGALVLGALDPTEREQVEAHLRTCPPCSAALAEIAPLPGLLHRVGLSATELEPAPDRVLEQALARVRAEQQAQRTGPVVDAAAAFAPEPVAPEPVAPEPVAPEPVAPEPVAEPIAPVVPLRRRRLPLLAAAAVALLAIVLGGAWWSQSSRAPASVTAMGSSAANGVSATVVMTPTDEGTTLDLTLSGVTPGEHCSLVAVGPDGTSEVASTWVANYEGEATITGSTWFSLADIERFDITTPDGRTLLEVPVPA